MIRNSGFRYLSSARPRQSAKFASIVALILSAVGIGAFAFSILWPTHSLARNAVQQKAPTVDSSFYSGMRWRLLGPYRAGRVSAVSGIPGDPATYYMGTPGGGVWKTTDAGRVWKPIFDQAHVASIGAVAIAPSNHDIVYVGTGEQTDGNGMYKSTDAGVTWTHIGLEDTHYISTVIVDPRNPDIVIVGVLGHPILGVSGPSAERGVFKSTDGGKTWKKTLYKDDMTGTSDLCVDPENPRVLFAAMWHPYDWRSGEGPGKAPDAWLYKSSDEGSTWKEITGPGLPQGAWDRTGVAIAPGNGGQRVYLITGPGLFRSDNAGATWRKMNDDSRVVGNFYFSRVFADPQNPDVVYVMQTTTYRSTDGGATFAAFKGAPGGDDYHVMWIDPRNTQRMILGVDQGATISVDGGKTWSSWYNQPTGQFYHVITDNQFPYVAYAPQQDSGTVAVPNRSDYGEISFRDWFSIGGFEYCYIAPDPLDPNVVYSGGWYGSVVRFDKRTGQISHVFVRGEKYHSNQMAPIIFSPQNPRKLYLGTQYLLASTDGGASWQEISPDLTVRPGTNSKPADGHASLIQNSPDKATAVADRDATACANSPCPAVPSEEPDSSARREEPAVVLDSSERRASVAASDDSGHSPSPMFDSPGPRLDHDLLAGGHDSDEDHVQAGPPKGALSTLAPSALQDGVIWAGTNNGIIQRTDNDGRTWQNVSPPNLSEKAQVEIVDAGHFDVNSAYASVIVPHDDHPYIYRTHDAGKTWQSITQDLPDNWIVWVVREDPVRKGLLYAGTGNGVYVSFDDGDRWQSLQLNLPAATVRDLVVHGNDLIVATYGRALWTLDDITPLRQAGADAEDAASSAFLFRPETAVRVRYDNDQETPLPPEAPAAKNPPDGAILDYFLKSVPRQPVTLEIKDAQGNVVRHFSSETPARDTTVKNVPDYWFGPLPQLKINAGMNRFVWDLRYDSPPTLPYSYWGGLADYIEYTLSDHALPEDTPREQTLGPIAIPGQYQAVLAVDGKRYTQNLNVVLDPRVHVSRADLEEQLAAGKKIAAGLTVSTHAYEATKALRAALADRQKSVAANAATKDAADALADVAKKLDAVQEGTPKQPGIGPVNRDLARVSFMVQSGDAGPSDTARGAIAESCSALKHALGQWRDLNATAVPAANAALAEHNLAPLPVAMPASGASSAQADACHD